MTTGREIVNKALQKIGVLTKTESPSGDEITDGLSALNAMIGSWSNDAMLIYVRVRESFPLIGGQSIYTIGTGQDFNTARPNFIVEAHVRLQDNVDLPLEIVTDEIYEREIPTKSSPGVPYWLNYDNGFPVGRIRLWYVPSAAYTLHLLSEKTLSDVALDTDISFPPGWERALIHNLAVEIAAEYGQEAPAAIQKIAADSLASIRSAVSRNRTMDAQASIGNYQNINTGWRNR